MRKMSNSEQKICLLYCKTCYILCLGDLMRKTARPFDPRQQMHRPDYEVFHYHDPKMQEVPLHHHDFYEIYYFLGGSVEYLVEGRAYRLEPEDVLLISPRELHRPNVAADVAYERIVLWIDAPFLASIDGDGALRRCFETGRNLLRGAHTPLASLIRQLAAEAASRRTGSELYARGLFFQLMAELLRLTEGSVPENAEDGEASLAARIVGYLNGHFREQISLDALAEHFYVSKYHLSHQFSRSVGTSVYRYILLKRLQHAKELLSEGVAPGEACRESGFQDYANFFRSFRAVYGLSPQDAAKREVQLASPS